MKFYKKYYFAIALLVASALGCDKIEAVKNQMFGAKDASSAAEQASASMKDKTPGPMAANDLVRVDQWTLTQEEFNEKLQAIKEAVPAFDPNNEEAQKLILEELINQQLLVMDAEKSGLAKSKDVSNAIEEFRRTVLIQERARELTQDIKATEEDAKAFYEQRKDLLIEPGQWRVREIVVDNEDKAKAILAEILQGADFAQAATSNSISETAANGGDLGLISDVPFPEMANPLLALEVGKVSNVFQGPDGFYIIKLEEKVGGNPLSFDEIKDEIIANQTLMKQQQSLLQHIEKLKNAHKIETNTELLK